MPTRRALIVSTSQYADPGLAPLPGTLGDARALDEALRTVGEFEVTVLADIPMAGIARARCRCSRSGAAS
ncbi:caspase family protein [Dactylosporangium darangshiense]|uniref:Peptidase C14 caspase domain-containing protein n=1 Tax=Dactylosporangium darangshiense TaxID=579108 RepID=A0ABP8DM71_9ACTN